ncbi:MAG: VWA domain-containing protein [Acidobacteriaceae bacterium]
MLPARFLCHFSAVLLAAACISPALAQSAPPPPLPNYTLHQHVREVLTDVTVTDAKGNPILNLPQSAFHVYDDNRPQTIDSFVAHSGNDLAVEPTSTSGVYSNAYLKHPPAVFNIALLDLTTMPIVDQMVLRQELTRFIQKLPPTEPLAVYMRNGPRIILVQNFTTNRADLLKAMQSTIPRFRTTGYEYDTDADVLRQIAGYLSQYPGRKNLLWFNAGSNLYLLSDAELASIDSSSSDDSSGEGTDYVPSGNESPSMRDLYDALDAERIALYPIDVRGLTVASDLAMDQQQMLMSEEAASTGGEALYNNNGIARGTRKILDHSADFYTLTYAPNDLHQRGRWHKIRITIDAPYHLNYRRGYFDDNYQATQNHHHGKPLTVAQSIQVAAPDQHSNPIVFKAVVHRAAAPQPNAPKHPRGFLPYTLYTAIPIPDFPIQSLNKTQSLVTFGAAVIVLDTHGDLVYKDMRILRFSFDKAQYQAHPNATTLWQEPVFMPKGENNIYLALWNTDTGRLGTLQIPIDAKKH